MAEVATAYVSILPSFKGAAAALQGEVTAGANAAATAPGVGAAGAAAGATMATGMKAKMASMGRAMFAPLGIIGGVALVSAAGKFIGSAITNAGDLQQSIGAVQTVFKDSSGQMLQWSNGAAKSVGLSKNEFNTLGTLIGTQLKNGGTAMDQLAPKTNDLIKLGADLSSMFGGTTSDAVGALSSALKGERDPIERYGISLTQASIDAKAAELGFTKVGGSFDKNAQQAATLALITDQSADAIGNFAKEGDTLQGKQQRNAASMENFKTSIGTALLPAVTGITTALGVFLDILTPVGEWFAKHQTLASVLAIGVGLLIAALVIAAIATSAFAASVWAATAAMLANPVTWIIVGIVALIAALVLLVANWDTVVAWLKSVWSSIVGWLAGVWDAIKSGLTTAWQAIASFFTGLWSSITSGITSAWNAVASFFTTIWNAIVNFARGVWQGLVSFFVGLWGAVTGAFTSVWNGISSTLAGVWNGIVNTGRNLWNNLVGFFQDIPGRIRGVFSDAASWLADAGKNIIQGLINGISGAVGRAVSAVKDAVGNVISGAKSLLGIGSPSKVFRAIGVDTALGLEIGLRESTASVTGAMRGLVVNPVKAATNDVTGAAGLGLPASVTLVDASGGILTQARVVADDALAAQARADAGSRQTRTRTW